MDSRYLIGTLGTCEIESGHFGMNSVHLEIDSIHLEIESKDQDMVVRNLEVDSRHMRWVLDK